MIFLDESYFEGMSASPAGDIDFANMDEADYMIESAIFEMNRSLVYNDMETAMTLTENTMLNEGFFKKAWDSIKAFFIKIWNMIKSVWNKLINWLKGIFSKKKVDAKAIEEACEKANQGKMERFATIVKNFFKRNHSEVSTEDLKIEGEGEEAEKKGMGKLEKVGIAIVATAGAAGVYKALQHTKKGAAIIAKTSTEISKAVNAVETKFPATKKIGAAYDKAVNDAENKISAASKKIGSAYDKAVNDIKSSDIGHKAEGMAVGFGKKPSDRFMDVYYKEMSSLLNAISGEVDTHDAGSDTVDLAKAISYIKTMAQNSEEDVIKYATEGYTNVEHLMQFLNKNLDAMKAKAKDENTTKEATAELNKLISQYSVCIKDSNHLSSFLAKMLHKLGMQKSQLALVSDAAKKN